MTALSATKRRAEFACKKSCRHFRVSSGKLVAIAIEIALIGRIAIQCNASGGSSASDEELSLDASNLSGGQVQATQRLSGDDAIDPFAYTFEDYVREISHNSKTSRAQEQTVQSLRRDSTNEIRRTDGNATSASSAERLEEIEAQENEIRSQFAWKRTPTNRCSKSCGAGRRVYHLSCVDLKYGVRVEPSLCRRRRRSNRPHATGARAEAEAVDERATDESSSELGDELCNQIDCEPKWVELAADSMGRDCAESKCAPDGNKFKRLECQMTDRSGKQVRVDDWRCESSDRSAAKDSIKLPSVVEHDSAPSSKGQAIMSEFEDEQVSLMDDNRVLVHGGGGDYEATPTSRPQSNERLRALAAHQPTSGEPHYVAGEWSECGGAPCAQLGRRERKLTCRLYLARSSKFAELPLSSCEALALARPDTEQPCYMDCGPEVGASNEQADSEEQASVLSTSNESNEIPTNATEDEPIIYGNDETVYDLDAARYLWRRDDWTECSAECLGGERESIVECWDKVAAKPVDTSHCSEQQRPDVLVEICNERPCKPQWRAEPFDESPHTCSRPCGSAGVRSRSVRCVQQVSRRSNSDDEDEQRGEHWLVVSDELCPSAQMPARTEPCNRWDCEPKWHLSAWSSCSRLCGLGVRNRTASCMQEFARRDSPVGQRDSSKMARDEHAVELAWRPRKIATQDLLEAMALSARDWHPGKLTQVPFRECYDHFRSVPVLQEHCYGRECNEAGRASAPPSQHARNEQSLPVHWIDSEPAQDYRMSLDLGANARRRTVSLKVGGRARVLEGKNLKLRCRLVRGARPSIETNRSRQLMRQVNVAQRVDWRKDGVRIFAENSTSAEKKPIVFDDGTERADNNSIWADQILLADQPIEAGAKTDSPTAHTAKRTQSPEHATGKYNQTKSARSISSHNSLSGLGTNFEFVPQAGGRFTLIKDNTLRIKRLRADDSGLYTCHWGSVQESIELSVVSRRELAHYEDSM